VLRATQERLQHILSSSQTIIYSLEIHGDDLVPNCVSDNITRIMGYESKSTSIAQWWPDHIHPDDREQVCQNKSILLAKGNHIHEYRFQAKSGEYHWIRDELRVLRDPEGRPVEVIGSWSDVTERQRTLAALRHRVEFEAPITTIATKFINLAPDQVDREIQKTLQAIGSFSGADWIYVVLLSRDPATMRMQHEWCAPGISPLIVRNRWPQSATTSVSPPHRHEDPTAHPPSAAEPVLLKEDGLLSGEFGDGDLETDDRLVLDAQHAAPPEGELPVDFERRQLPLRGITERRLFLEALDIHQPRPQRRSRC
jgi:PAS domain S-box-containing protein